MEKLGLNELPAKVRWPSRTSKADGDQLVKAVLAGKISKIQKLIKAKGIPPDSRSKDGQTPLFCAAFLGRKDIIKTLLRSGAHPNSRCLPEGYTAVHGACYVGSVKILKLLLECGGDLRLMDTKRQHPLDWTEFQPNLKKRRAIRDFTEGARFCIMQPSPKEVTKEVSLRLKSTREITIIGKLRDWFRLCFSSTDIIWEHGLTSSTQRIISIGFGEVHLSSGFKCAQAIGLPWINEISDLNYEANPKAPSWICGKFSTFIPMTWHSRNTSVTLKALRYKSVEEAVPDILIAELETLIKLHHPGILMLLAVCQEENYSSISLVFEKVSLGSLFFFLHNSALRMKSTFATDLVIQVSEALDYVHASGYLHCGISSHSIMLVNDNHVKLSCFEYAVPDDSRTDPANSIVSNRHPWLQSESHMSVYRHWMAPELITGNNRPSQASDIYSLCSVMWELVIGEVPWKDFSLEQLKAYMKESPGIRLPLHKEIIPPLWLSVLTVGLKPKREERDLDFGELRYMMTLAKEKSLSSTDAGNRRSISSRASLRSINYNDPVMKAEDAVDALDGEVQNTEIQGSEVGDGDTISKIKPQPQEDGNKNDLEIEDCKSTEPNPNPIIFESEESQV